MGFLTGVVGGGPNALPLGVSIKTGTAKADKVRPVVAVAAAILRLSRPSPSTMCF